jgi:hypothetical protein
MITLRPTRQLHMVLQPEEKLGSVLAAASQSVKAPPRATGTKRTPLARQPRGSS